MTSLRKSSIERAQAGFTLIEVLISMLLLAIISLSIYQATTQTFKYREILIREGDFYNGIRLALGIIERDVEQMYSPIVMNPNTVFPGIDGGPEATVATLDPNAVNAARNSPPPARGAQATATQAKQAALEGLLNSELAQVSDYWLGASDITGIRPSRFVGETEKMRFITSAHNRLYKGSRESTFAKVAYELRNDPSEDKIEGTKVLVRIEDPNVFDDTEKKLKWAKTYPLLTGVKSFKLRFYRRDKKAWETGWDNGKEFQKNLYPDLVEIVIEVTGSQRLNFKGTYTFRPELPFRGLPKTF